MTRPYPTRAAGEGTQIVVSVIVPVFNEQASIVQVLDRLVALPLSLQVIAVDDGSTDGTRDALAKFSHEAIEVVTCPVNAGKGAALRRGFAQARGDIVVVQDADLEYDPAEIPQLIQPLLAGTADAVFGSRFLRPRSAGSSRAHRLANRGLTALSNLTTGLSLTDMETGYKAFRRDVIRSLPLQQDRFGVEPEITAKLARRRYRVVEVPIRYTPRSWVDGKKIGVCDGLRAIYCVVRYGLAD